MNYTIPVDNSYQEQLDPTQVDNFGYPLAVYTVKKEGPNFGRQFLNQSRASESINGKDNKAFRWVRGGKGSPGNTQPTYQQQQQSPKVNLIKPIERTNQWQYDDLIMLKKEKLKLEIEKLKFQLEKFKLEIANLKWKVTTEANKTLKHRSSPSRKFKITEPIDEEDLELSSGEENKLNK
jgi:hypothetical protein